MATITTINRSNHQLRLEILMEAVRKPALLLLACLVLSACDSGSDSNSFTVTPVDITPPSAAILFPPVQSMSDGDTVMVRGRTIDDLSPISSVVVNGVDAQTSDDFANWTAVVPLTTGDNEIAVAVTDSAGNSDDNAASVSVLKTEPMLGFTRAVAVDEDNNRALVADTEVDAIIAVDLTSGERSILSNSSTITPGSEILGFFNPIDIVVDAPRDRALVIDQPREDILAVDLTTGEQSIVFESEGYGQPLDMVIDGNRLLVIYQSTNLVLAYDLETGVSDIVSDDSTPDSTNPLVNPVGITVDGGRALVANNIQSDSMIGTPGDPPNIIEVNLTTGARTVFSDNDSGGPDFSLMLVDIIVEDTRAWVVTGTESAFVGITIYELDLSDGSRTVFSNNGNPSGQPTYQLITDLAYDSANDRILTVDTGSLTEQVIAVAPATGERTLVSSDTNTFNNGGSERIVGANGIALDAANDRLLAAERIGVFPASLGGNLKAIDRTTGEYEILTDLGFTPFDIAIDEEGNRALVIDSSADRIVAVDLDDGTQSEVALDPGGNRSGLEIDPSTNQAYFVQESPPQVIRLDLTSDNTEVISDNTTPNADNPFSSLIDITLDLDNERAFVLDQTLPEIFVVDLTDGSRTVFSTTGDAETELLAPHDIQLDSANNRLILSDIGSDTVMAIDLDTGERTVISSGTVPNGNNAFGYASQVLVDPDEPTRAWVSDRGLNAILTLDLVTGERVISSR